MTATALKEYHDCSAHGKRLRVIKEVRGYQNVRSHTGTFSSVVTLQPGVIVRYVRHCIGPGSDPAYEAIVKIDSLDLGKGRLAKYATYEEIHIQVGWFDLRTDTFELMEKDNGKHTRNRKAS